MRLKLYLPRCNSRISNLLSVIAKSTKTEVKELSAWRFDLKGLIKVSGLGKMNQVSPQESLFRKRSYDPETLYVRVKTPEEMKFSPAKPN